MPRMWQQKAVYAPVWEVAIKEAQQFSGEADLCRGQERQIKMPQMRSGFFGRVAAHQKEGKEDRKFRQTVVELSVKKFFY